MTLLDFLKTKYRDGARGENSEHDCWDLTRKVRHFIYGRPLLPSYAGLNRSTPKAFAEAALVEVQGMQPIEEPIAGCCVCVFKGLVCYHVAVCIEDGGQLKIMDTNPKQNVKVHEVGEFLRKFKGRTVKYYD